LQEKLNAYASFILDGKMRELYPYARPQDVQIVIRSRGQPPQDALQLVGLVRQALERTDPSSSSSRSRERAGLFRRAGSVGRSPRSSGTAGTEGPSPDLRAFGAGARMRAAGFEALVSAEDVSMMGVAEVVPRCPGSSTRWTRFATPRAIAARAPRS